ncbi:MAG: sugar O-acyltransferase (sialic acid O-acetyltransferase NeuD family) [Paraglaciecola sp.]|jgi:sugar O-acyltransferase (sialic acid O-acetyltransferase NeuD family)
MTKRLIIIGAGGHGKVAADCAEAIGDFSEIVFLDGIYPALKKVEHWPVVGKGDDLSTFADPSSVFFVAIGNNQTRASLMTAINKVAGEIVTLIHPSAMISRYVTIGAGTLVCANVVINIASNIGRGCIINTSSSVDHDCKIDDYVHLAPGTKLAGTINIGEYSFVGIGGVIIPSLTIGKHCILGAGSTLLEDLPDCSVAVGTPAKIIKIGVTK